MTVKLDKLREATVRQDFRGVEVTRQARLTGISGDSQRRPREALEAQGLPRYGDPHPAWPDLRCVEINLVPVDVSQWEASLVYRSPTPEEKVNVLPVGTVSDVSWFATTVTEERSFDVNGNAMWHYYSGKPVRPVIIGRGVKFKPTTLTQIAVKHERATVQKPSIGARVLIPESASIQKKLGYVGSINRQGWSNYPARTWLVGAVDSRFEQGRWHNTYTLYYNPETWRFRSVVDWAGTVPSDARVGNGIAYFSVYPETNWNVLGFFI